MNAFGANRGRVARSQGRLEGEVPSEDYIYHSICRSEEDGTRGHRQVNIFWAAHAEHERGSNGAWRIGTNRGVGCADREWAVRVVGDFDQGLAADHLDLALVRGQPGPDLAVRVELDGSAICKGDMLVTADTGRIRYPL